MPLSTDFNVSPYFDDYNEAKKYYRMLYRPATAVQARELTQTQTIIQNQIERFGNHMFQDGSVVEGCNGTVLKNLDFVRLVDTFTANAAAFVTDITRDYLLVGQTSNVRAVAVYSKSGFEVNYPDTNRFYVRYLTTGVNGETTFANSELLYVYNASQDKLGSIDANNFVNSINVLDANSTVNAVGKGVGFRVEDGIIFHKGFFQLVEDQVIIVRDYDQTTGNTVVGFETTEEIITENQDESLLDNALGYSNENAPGAHRLKLTPTAVAKERTAIANNDTFFAVYEFSSISNDLVLNKTKNPYDTIGSYIDSRTYDESGDYVTKPFLIESIVGPDSNTFSYQISSGKGYVHGSQIEYLAAKSVDADRAYTSLLANAQIITTNYGNFVYANEVSGALDFSNFVQIDLYDNTGFQAVTNRFTPSFTGKSKVGTAKIKAVLHDSGDPGQPGTRYRVFLTDISMNNGKSFSSDVKGLYANSTVNPYGAVYMDVANSTTKATLQQSGKNTLIFPFGKKALKTLKSGGNTATQFYYRATSNATLQTNGFFSVTVASSYTGGIDRLGYSTGLVGDTLEEQFLVVSTANVSTVNISGTVTTSGTTVTGSGLNTYFANGEFIKLYTTTSTIDYRRVVSANNTTIVIDAAVTSSNGTGANFGKHIPAGYIIPLENSYPGTRYANVTSNTTFEVSIGVANGTLALTGTSPVTVQYRMLRTQATQAKKDVKKDRFVKLYANTANNNSWNLGLTDVFSLKHVYANTTGFTNNDNDDITSYFTFDSGQKDDYYDHGKLVLKPQYVGLLGNKYLTVVVDHFSANLNNGVGFFSVDSYPTTNGTANSTTINWQEIPVYKSSSGNFDRRDCVDFRAVKQDTAISATILSDASINPAVTNNFISYSATYLSEADTNFQANIEYYLGRIDLITMNSTGGLNVVQGTPSENPRTPKSEVDAMVLATATVAPWPSLTAREAESSGRSDYSTKTKIETNRGYTMRDIGLLDQRIQRLEYYTTLNQLEQQAQNIQVPDSNGLNRFKNGIFTDPMNSHYFGLTTDFEYRWSIDSRLGYGRPLFSSENVDLKYDSANSSNVTLTGKYITKPYTHERYIYQPFATKYRNNTQDLWAWAGTVELYPNYDMNRDESRLPNIDINIDLTQPFLDFGNIISQATGATIFGTRWGDWVTESQSSSTAVTGRWSEMGPWWSTRNYTQFTQTTVSQQARAGVNTFIVPMSQQFDLGTYVTDVSVQPYVKSRIISFIARNMKPNTRIYGFFDDTAVSQYIAPAALNTSKGATLAAILAAVNPTGRQEDVLVRTGNYGDPLVSDSTGTVYGMFLVPEGTFRTGDRQFQLLDSDILTDDDAGYLTRAAATFTASNIAVTKRGSTITTQTPTFQQIQLREDRTVISQSSWVVEPIAQGLTIEAAQQQSGVFVTKMDLFFKAKDPNLGVSVVMVGMLNGVPDSTTIYGRARVNSADVNISDDATAATTFTFNEPIFLSANKEYAFYIEPEGGSPEFKMWVAEMGDFDVTTGAQVYMNPYSGDSYRSSNARTWTAMPREDVKFNLYVANFSVGSGTAYFHNEDDEYITYSTLALSNSQNSVAVGDEVFMINSTSNVAITNNNVKGFVQFIDTTNSKLILDGSANGGFSNGATLGIFRLPEQGNVSLANATSLIATATLDSLDNYVLHTVVPRFSTMQPSGTTIDFSYKAMSNSAVLDSSYNELGNDIEREMLDYERRVYSKSNELALPIEKSMKFKATFNNTNKYVSPVIDVSRKSALVIKNIINNDSANEWSRYGNAKAKYVGQQVLLADGQEAEDLKIYLSAYRPINTDIEVYVKFHNNEDPDVFDTKAWTKLDNNSAELRSSPIDIYDFKEYVYTVPNTVNYSSYTVYANTYGANATNDVIYLNTANSIFAVNDRVYYSVPSGNTVIAGLTANSNYYVTFANLTHFAVSTSLGGANANITESRTTNPGENHTFSGPVVDRAYRNQSNFGIIQYNGFNREIYQTFKSFSVKIVLLSSDGVYVPKVDNLRGIALQV